MRARMVGVVFVLGLVAVGVAVAGANRNWSTHANGSLEVPAARHERAGSGDLPPVEGRHGASVQADRVEHRERRPGRTSTRARPA